MRRSSFGAAAERHDQVFSSYDVAGIPNSTQWPFSADYSCWSGYFINLYIGAGDYRSLAEAELLNPKKGSVAVSAPSGLHTGSALVTLNQGLVKAVFQDRVQPVGAAVNAAKAYYYAHAVAWPDVIDTMIFFGDPAMPLRLPRLPFEHRQERECGKPLVVEPTECPVL